MPRKLAVVILVLLGRGAFAQPSVQPATPAAPEALPAASQQPPAPPQQPPASPQQPPASPPQQPTPPAAPSPGQSGSRTLGQQQPPSDQSSESLTIINQKHYIRVGNVEIHSPNGTSIFAEQVEFFDDEDRALASGNVLLVQGNNRISAERAEFNTKTSLGTFYHASGIATVPPPRPQPPRPGTIALPPITGQDTVVYFFGETVEKVGPKRYKITKGGFSTCVQPTPRWDMHADTVLLNVDHYTVLKQAVLTVKGVPMLYLPILYYPTKRGERATGFLIPAYGSSSLRGQSLHNAFFWAIDRSQDATIMHDYFSKTGQGVGGEYRYNYGGGTDGNFRTYLLDQHLATYTQSDGSTVNLPASRNYEVRGNANQVLPGNLRARARVDYFSNIVTSQTFNMNVYDASRNQSTFGGNLVGAWGGYTMNATLNHSEYFYDINDSVLSGSWPQISFNRNERPLFGSQVYVSVGSEFAHLLSDSRSKNGDVQTENNQNLNRLDFSPQLRYPFKRWQWLTANSTISWRDTYYSRILSPVDPTGVQLQKITDESFNRRVVTLQTQIVGPVFNRIWDTPTNNYAEKFKHSIEPFLTIQKTSDVQNFDRIVRFDGVDTFVGGTQYTYGLSNRFYAKRKVNPGQPSQSREIVDVELRQSYYTNQAAAQYDSRYQTNLVGVGLVGGGTPSNFSPIALNIRALPSNDVNATVTMEFDSRYHSLRTISVNGSYSWAQQIQTNVVWSKRGFIPKLIGFNDPRFLDQFINPSMTVRTRSNRYGATYNFNYDLLQGNMLQQRVTGFYNAQCCGLAVEYQTYNFGSNFGVPNSGYPIPSDHRFFLSFTLAGLGNFSPFSGALGGVPR